jgi:hypothetical protein
VANTLTFCSYLLVVLGMGMTAWLLPNPLVFLPYVFLFFAVRAARRAAVRGLVLAVILASVGVSFWFCWDAAYVHLSTMNSVPLLVAGVELVIAVGMDFLVWAVEKRYASFPYPKA